MDNGAIVFVRVPYGEGGMTILWPGWVVSAEEAEVEVQTTGADGRRREVVRAPADQVHELGPLASEPTAGLTFARDERVLVKIARPDSLAEAEGYDIWTSIHDVPEGAATATCSAYAHSLSGGPAMGYSTPAPVKTLTPVREVVANIARARG